MRGFAWLRMASHGFGSCAPPSQPHLQDHPQQACNINENLKEWLSLTSAPRSSLQLQNIDLHNWPVFHARTCHSWENLTFMETETTLRPFNVQSDLFAINSLRQPEDIKIDCARSPQAMCHPRLLEMLSQATRGSNPKPHVHPPTYLRSMSPFHQTALSGPGLQNTNCNCNHR